MPDREEHVRTSELARVLTAVEDGDVGTAERWFAAGQNAGSAHLVGITGSPGVGKSTLVNRLIGEVRSRGLTVAVLAIDPSSPYSAGALLGDRVRMLEHAGDDSVFIRSMAARGQLGGLSAAAPLGALMLEAAGFDTVVVETVGVGQSEVDVAAVCDTTAVVLSPGMGDRMQAGKAGLMEIADVFAVNRADQGGAGRTVREVVNVLDARQATRRFSWRPPVLRCSAMTGEGIVELVDALQQHRHHLVESELARATVVRRMGWILRKMATTRFERALAADDTRASERLEQLTEQVLAGELLLSAAAEELTHPALAT